MATLKLGVKLTVVAAAPDRCYTLQTKKLKQEEDSVQEKRKAGLCFCHCLCDIAVSGNSDRSWFFLNSLSASLVAIAAKSLIAILGIRKQR